MRFTAVLLLLVNVVVAQTPQVPHKMNFAGITLTIRDDARREIQKDVDALTQSPKYFNIKVERARTYFPIIEKIFEEERLPDDFKYLVLQESALIADAVSVSDAVGFWQFKDFTAIEMGLRVDRDIDERMNISSSTRAAAQYIKKNNYYFNNWVYALQAYQMGAGGVLRSVSDYESGAKHMEINSKTYWYVKKFLAHKVAFEGAVKGPGEIKIVTYENNTKKSLTDIAAEFSVSPDQLEQYNKWARKGHIPEDRQYSVAIPVQGDAKNIYAAVARANEYSVKQAQLHKKPDVKTAQVYQNEKKYIHGIPAIKAVTGESSATLAKRAGVRLSFFLKCNDLGIGDQIIDGQYYYLKRKKTKTYTAQHAVVSSDENLWSISQQYGVRLKSIKKLNPTVASNSLKKGTVIALPTGLIPTSTLVDNQQEIVELERGEFFDWSVNPQTQSASALPAIQLTVPGTEVSQQEAISEKVIEVLPADQHVVSPGETLYSIAKRYNTSVMDIVNINQLKLEEGIKPGQVLKLSSSVSTQPAVRDNYIIYEIKPSDTLYSIARQYGVTIKEIMDWNQKKDFNVTTGEKLRIQQK